MAPKFEELDPEGTDSEEETPKAPQVPSKIKFEATGASDKTSDSSQLASEINFEATGDSQMDKAEEPKYPNGTFCGMF